MINNIILARKKAESIYSCIKRLEKGVIRMYKFEFSLYWEREQF